MGRLSTWISHIIGYGPLITRIIQDHSPCLTTTNHDSSKNQLIIHIIRYYPLPTIIKPYQPTSILMTINDYRLSSVMNWCHLPRLLPFACTCGGLGCKRSATPSTARMAMAVRCWWLFIIWVWVKITNRLNNLA